MENKTLNTLEYNKIIDRLKDLCQSNLGKERASEVLPGTDIQIINKELARTADALALILKYSNPPLYGIHDLTAIVKRLNRGGILENIEFMNISSSLRVAQALKDFVSEFEAENIIKNEISRLYTNKRIQTEIDRIIVDEEEIADDASRALFAIRRNIRNKSEEIRRKLNSIITDKDNQIRLQESIVTVRDGRYVVPVKAESKRAIPGIAHDRSSTGQTVYIEPMVVVELNNEIRQLQIQEQDEIRRILKELSDLCNDYSEDILVNEEILISLDLVFAKARLALEMKASRPIINEDRIIDIKKARHPLLDPSSVVPIDLKLGENFKALIVTGPNTGGKTVSLKTLGLMILMSQAGMFIPAEEFSKVGIFENIYADIGDKQSIELSLSTFSASMTNIVSILNKADDKSLVLFDELGSGTDPTEGAALAMAIIDYLIKKDVYLVSTTHYSELKLYAMTTEGVQNASVEFNVESLSPTFRLIIGAPGKSNAFEISKRLGLSDQVLTEAGKYISKENRDFESLISEIETDRIKAEERLKEVEKLKLEYQRLNRKLEEDITSKREKAREEVEASKEEAIRILDEARLAAKDLIKNAKKSIGQSSNLDRLYSEISDKSKDLSKKYKNKTKAKTYKGEALEDVKVGESVRIISMDDEGVVVTLPDSKGDLMVQVGILKFSANVKDLQRIENKEEKKSKSQYKNVLKQKAGEEYSTSIDLRGLNVDEAIGEVEKYFDNAILIGLKEVQLIHGKGTGALREGLNNYLRKSRYVDQYRMGTLKEGGAGVTVVTLK